MVLNMNKVIEEYNDIMCHCCYEHATIGTQFSEGTEDWNLRDMVAECDYLADFRKELLDESDDKEERAMFRKEIRMCNKFVQKYESYVEDMVCSQGHCSRFDNCK